MLCNCILHVLGLVGTDGIDPEEFQCDVLTIRAEFIQLAPQGFYALRQIVPGFYKVQVQHGIISSVIAAGKTVKYALRKRGVFS